MMSVEAEKDSNARYSSISIADVFGFLGELDEIPDIVCTSGWWWRDHIDKIQG